MNIRVAVTHVLKKLRIYGIASWLYRKLALMWTLIWNIPVKYLVLSDIDKVVNDCEETKNVFLFQYSYFTKDGEKYISGGAERYMSDIAEIILQMGMNPILFQMGMEQGDQIWKRVKDNLVVIGIPGNFYQYHQIIKKLPPPQLSIYSGYVDFGKCLQHPNILISHGITWDFPGYDAKTNKILSMIKKVDSLVSVDTNTISWLRSTYSHYLFNHKKTFYYIPNYVDLKKYVPIKKTDTSMIRILFPRRCCIERGFWLMAEVVPQILEQHQNVIVEFVGYIHSLDIEEELQRLKKIYGEKVQHRFINSNEMYQVYQNADISVIPTLYSEGTSLSCIEAMACGNAIVATNIGGLTNLIIDRYNGLLIDPAKDALIFALEKLIESSALRENLGINACNVAKTFSKENWEQQWKKVILESIGK